MYYSKNNVYISKDESILFDLDTLDIYEIDEKTFRIFNNLYFSESINCYEDDADDIYQLLFTGRRYVNLADNINSVRVNVSNTCNLRCKYCYANHGNYGTSDRLMSIEIADLVCKYIGKFIPNIKEVSFFGGEPLLNIDIIEYICERLYNRNIKFSMVTNLSILNDKIISTISK